LQQVGTWPDIWRRASRSPAPRAATEVPPLRRKRGRFSRSRRWRFPSRRIGLTAGALAAIALFLAAGGRAPAPILPEIERLADAAGLGLQQVAVSGHRFTPDGDIFDALRLEEARTLLSFDSGAARQRIERLPWVERASIERIIPDRLEVRIVERAPFAVWHAEGRTFLIDRSGRVLTPIAPDAMPALRRLSGEGAPREAAALHELLGGHAGLLDRVKLAERVGGRRWRLHLADGSTIELPVSGEREALARGLALARSGVARGGEIDLRADGRILLRTSRGAVDRNKRVTGAPDAPGRS
jgi:cell division protein FtsQ